MDFFNTTQINQEVKKQNSPPDFFSFENEEHKETTSEGELSKLSELAQRQLELIKLLDGKYKEVKKLLDELNILRLEKIPDFMEGIGLNDITIKDDEGNLFPINIEKKWTASLTKEKKPEALKWLADNDFGSLVKKTISFECDASEDGDEEFENIKKVLIENLQENFQIDEKVHAATLKSFIKEQVDEGNDELDLKLFSAFQVKQSVIDKVKIPDFKKVK